MIRIADGRQGMSLPSGDHEGAATELNLVPDKRGCSAMTCSPEPFRLTTISRDFRASPS